MNAFLGRSDSYPSNTNLSYKLNLTFSPLGGAISLPIVWPDLNLALPRRPPPAPTPSHTHTHTLLEFIFLLIVLCKCLAFLSCFYLGFPAVTFDVTHLLPVSSISGVEATWLHSTGLSGSGPLCHLQQNAGSGSSCFRNYAVAALRHFQNI